METLYRVTLHSQMGPREGLLRLHWTGNRVEGLLQLVGHENSVWGERTEDGRILLRHKLKTALGEHACLSVLRLSEGRLDGIAELSGCKMKWSGAQLHAGDMEEHHCEYQH